MTDSTPDTPDLLPGALVLNDGHDRASWQQVRASGIVSATAATAIAGTNPYRTVLDVWNRWHDATWEEERNAWLDQRADHGVDREPFILATAHELVGGEPFTPNVAFYGSRSTLYAGATPDGWRLVPGRTLTPGRDGATIDDTSLTAQPVDAELIEAKTTGQDWRVKGLPPHIYDQAQWQLVTTAARCVHIVAEQWKWGRGKAGADSLLARYAITVWPDLNRQAFLRGRVEWFLGLVEAGIAPESDLDITDLALGELTDGELDEQHEEVIIGMSLDRIDAIDAELAALPLVAKLTAERADLLADVKRALSAFEGRRVHVTRGRYVAKLVRSMRSSVDMARLPESAVRAATSWKETDTVKVERVLSDDERTEAAQAAAAEAVL